MVTWLFRQLLSIFDDDIGSDIGDERAMDDIPGQRNSSAIPDSHWQPGDRQVGDWQATAPGEGQRSVT
jgi:hypothetical protein